MSYFKGNREYFPGIGRIAYEGPGSDNPLAFKFYDENKMVGDKTMKEHLRFAVAYWHSFCADGSDPFGSGPRTMDWNEKSGMDGAKEKLDAAFEFFTKIGAPHYCFHDRDIAPEGSTVGESEKNLQTITNLAKERQDATGVKLLWGTANVFSHPRYMNGASTNPDYNVVANAAAQVKAALEATVKLGGENYVFWGGREGYMSLWNTEMGRELDHMARFLTMARDYGRKIGFKGPFLIEPKPMEPSKHQYDFDSSTVVGFLRKYELDRDFKLNIEANHATLAQHSFAHELEIARAEGMFGSVDANRGDPQNGWDTDQFPFDVYDTTEAMVSILKSGGFSTGGLNFDAKIRRNSTDREDLFLAHIGGMDAFALGLEKAWTLLNDSELPGLVKERYASFDKGQGQDFENGKMTLDQLAAEADYGKVKPISGKQEKIENIINRILFTK
ncbi:MAG: xylose isomerase [Spirochaetales bacterium]|nr:xylose isomerase [Spirochaetales bacterium]